MAKASWGVAYGFVVLTVGVLVAGSPALAARARPRDPVDEARYAEALGTHDPALVTLFHKGTDALDADALDDARAAFAQILARVPDHAPTLRRESYVETKQGHIDEGIELARRAWKTADDPVNLSALAIALVADKSRPSSQAEAAAIANRLIDMKPDAEYALIAAQVALNAKNTLVLGRAVAVLDRVAPADRETGFLGAIYHAEEEEYALADAALSRAEAAGLPAEAAARFREEAGITQALKLRRWARASGIFLGAWVIGLGAIFLSGWALSRRTMSSVERLAPDPSDALVTQTRTLRRAYKGAIGVAAVYYYVSIPIVTTLLLALVGLLIYGVLAVGHIPIKLIALIVIGAGVSIWSLLRSLFVRRGDDSDPGLPLPEAEAPALWAALRDIAARVGTRPVDAVYLTPGTDVSVTERGTFSARMADRGRRHLTLGLGVLPGLTRRQLSAILAHEYGHFSNRDTAGGDVARAVVASLFTAVIGIARGGGASVFNPAWHFLRVFLALFQRVTLGASRLQEVLADRFAVTTFGGRAFSEGLRHVVERSIRFGRESDALIAQAQQSRVAIANLYAPALTPSPGLADVDKTIAEALNDVGSPYDSHPPVAKRIAWASAHTEGPPDAVADGPAWDLFTDRAALEAKMTGLINDHLARNGAIAEPAATPP